jgi:hypothetical protein
MEFSTYEERLKLGFQRKETTLLRFAKQSEVALPATRGTGCLLESRGEGPHADNSILLAAESADLAPHART